MASPRIICLECQAAPNWCLCDYPNYGPEPEPEPEPQVAAQAEAAPEPPQGPRCDPGPKGPAAETGVWFYDPHRDLLYDAGRDMFVPREYANLGLAGEARNAPLEELKARARARIYGSIDLKPRYRAEPGRVVRDRSDPIIETHDTRTVWGSQAQTWFINGAGPGTRFTDTFATPWTPWGMADDLGLSRVRQTRYPYPGYGQNAIVRVADGHFQWNTQPPPAPTPTPVMPHTLNIEIKRVGPDFTRLETDLTRLIEHEVQRDLARALEVEEGRLFQHRARHDAELFKALYEGTFSAPPAPARIQDDFQRAEPNLAPAGRYPDAQVEALLSAVETFLAGVPTDYTPADPVREALARLRAGRPT